MKLARSDWNPSNPAAQVSTRSPRGRRVAVALAALVALKASVARAEPAAAAVQDAPPEPPASSPEVPADDDVPSAPSHKATLIVASPPRARAEPDRASSEPAPRYDFIRVNAGVRIGYVPSRGFDAYSSNDVLPQLSIDGTYPVFQRDKLVLALGLGWDIGGSSDKVRGFDASVTAHRFYVPVEGRYHVRPWVYGFAKIAPGAAVMMASVKDGTVPDALSATGWALSADASAGASILLGSRSHLGRRALRFWATPEIGYAYTTDAPLEARAGRDEAAVLGSDESTPLRSLALSGLFWRVSLGATF